ncbi:MAG TPA: Asp23/Gls24 family envelope stress response protein [Anaerolineales bacterium]|nr:Asp23/Gls24 family envelope stress response protein [Anaerolineales bacterium]
MDNQTTTTNRPPGKTTIAPSVLLTIARLATLDIQGVSRMAECPGGLHLRAKRSQADGISIMVEDDRVNVDIYVIIKQGFNARDLSRNIQQEVARAISKMVGMEVGQINIHIEDVDYPSAPVEA